MKIVLILLAVLMAGATLVPSNLSEGADMFLNATILIGAGVFTYAAGSIDQ